MVIIHGQINLRTCGGSTVLQHEDRINKTADLMGEIERPTILHPEEKRREVCGDIHIEDPGWYWY